MTVPTQEEAEFYETPDWCVHRLLEAIDKRSVLPTEYREMRWLDPCVGEGAIPLAMGSMLNKWTTIDIRPSDAAQYTRDYVNTGLPAECMVKRDGFLFDGSMYNPPFSKALGFAKLTVKQCAITFMLQRLSWMQGPTVDLTRTQWLRENPFDLYVLPDRPSYRSDGKTGAEGYGWYSWPSMGKGVVILNNTPKWIRTRQAVQAAATSQQELFDAAP